jgi:acetyl esterase
MPFMKTVPTSLAVIIICAAMASNAKSDDEGLTPDKIIPYKEVPADQGPPLNLEVFLPEGRQASETRPAVVFFFGGGWTGGSPKQFYQQARDFADIGYVAISADYRTKKSHGTSPFECVADGKSAIRWMRQHANELGIDPDMIVAGGGSAGGHVAACTGVIEGRDEPGEDLSISSVPNVMILSNPVIDTTEKGYGANKFDEDQTTTLSPAHHVRKGLPPTLVVHGTADTTVPFENAERFAKSMNEAGNACVLVPFEGRQHGFFNGSFFRPNNGDDDYDAIMEKSLEFLAEQGYPVDGCGMLHRAGQQQ